MGKTSTDTKRKYNEKTYSRIEIVVLKDNKQKLVDYAKTKEMSLAEYIKHCVEKDSGLDLMSRE